MEKQGREKGNTAARWDAAADSLGKGIRYRVNPGDEKESWRLILLREFGAAPKRILDIGTGKGFIALMLAEMGHRVTAVDISPVMIEHARFDARLRQLHVEFLVGDACRLPFADESFDGIINRHVFWTMPEPNEAAAEWARVLKPGGKLVVIDGDWLHPIRWKKTLKKALSLVRQLRGKSSVVKQGLTDFEKKLPLLHERRPEADVKLFMGLGLKTQARPFQDPRAGGFLNHVEHGCYRRFMVTAVK